MKTAASSPQSAATTNVTLQRIDQAIDALSRIKAAKQQTELKDSVATLKALRGLTVNMGDTLVYVAEFLGAMGFCSMGGPDCLALRAVAEFENPERSWHEPLDRTQPESPATMKMVGGAIFSIEEAIDKYEADELEPSRFALEHVESIVRVLADAAQGQALLRADIAAFGSDDAQGTLRLERAEALLERAHASLAASAAAHSVFVRGGLE